MAPKKGPSVRSYVLIKPKEVTFFGIIRLLFSSRLSNISFIEASPDEGDKIRDIWFKLVLAASAWMQGFLDKIRVPMGKIGDLIQILLNLLSVNGGLFKLLTNLMKGKVVLPVPTTAASIIGNLDSRLDLDPKISPNDDRYLGALAMMAAKLAYESAAFVTSAVTLHWKMQFMGLYNFWNDYHGRASTPAFMFKDKLLNANLIGVAFRGTDPFSADGWSTDIDLSYYEIANVGKVHRGFAKALGIVQKGNAMPSEVEVKNELGSEEEDEEGLGLINLYAYFEIVRLLKLTLKTNPRAKFIVTGHSLGGALAVMFAAALCMHEETDLLSRLAGVYTYGQPRVGDEQFGKYMAEKLSKYSLTYNRYVYSFDIVPRIPFDDKSFLYKHFGNCIFFDSFYNGKVLPEAPNKNYFSLIWWFPKLVNAMWELLRAFTIPVKRGSDYKEGWFQIVFRVFGIMIPGLSAHGPQDYVNMTRLGTITTELVSLPEDFVKITVK